MRPKISLKSPTHWHPLDNKFNWKVVPDGYEPKVLFPANHIKESRLSFAIKQEDTAVNFYWWTSLALPTMDGLSEQPSCDGVQKPILEEDNPTKEISSPAGHEQILRAVELRQYP